MFRNERRVSDGKPYKFQGAPILTRLFFFLIISTAAPLAVFEAHMLTVASKRAVVFFARCPYETYRTHARSMEAFRALYGKLTTSTVGIATIFVLTRI